MNRRFLFLLSVLVLCLSFAAPVAAKDITVTVSVEKFTLGEGYILEPTLVTVPENTLASTVITSLLTEDNYKHTGKGSDLYISYIRDENISEEKAFPKYLVSRFASNQERVSTRRFEDWLGEFDYCTQSGWMYCVDNSFPDVGCGQYVLKDGDVMRWQFTVCGLGSDLGADNSQWGTASMVSTANKDALVRKIAEINAMENPAVIKSSKAYKNAMVLLENIQAKQEKIDGALAALNTYLESGTDALELETNGMVQITLKPGDDLTPYSPPSTVYPKSISVNYNTAEIREGETLQLSATVLPENASDKTVIWGSSCPEVATVDANGVVTAVSTGKATIMARTVNYKRAVCEIVVKDSYIAPDEPIPIKMPFEDVSSGDYYYDAVLWALREAVTTGVSANAFDPQNVCTRGQMVTFLWRANGRPEPKTKNCAFTDVKAEDYYYSAVLWAVENGITNGVSSTTFAPNDKVTRGQVVTFLYRNAKEPSVSGKMPFTDVPSGEYYYKAVLWAVANEITTGVSATEFAPGVECTRGQIVTFLYRAR